MTHATPSGVSGVPSALFSASIKAESGGVVEMESDMAQAFTVALRTTARAAFHGRPGGGVRWNLL